MSVRRVSVFCGSSPGGNPEHLRAGRTLGRELASRGIGLVYGGASVGMMGELARAVVRSGGSVTGVIPGGLADAEIAFTELTDLRIVDSMHARKALMVDLSDGFVAMPGGLGTLDEFFEVVTCAQLGLHSKPCCLLDVRGYFSLLLQFLDAMVVEKFVGPVARSLVLVADDPGGLLDQIASYRAPRIDKLGRARELSNR